MVERRGVPAERRIFLSSVSTPAQRLRECKRDFEVAHFIAAEFHVATEQLGVNARGEVEVKAAGDFLIADQKITDL